MTPLEILARSMDRYGVPNAMAKELFGAYGEFLALLNNEKSRKALETLRSQDSRTDKTFQRVRKSAQLLNMLSITSSSRTHK